MKKLQEGLQFNVFLENNKIIKTPTSLNQIKKKLISWNPDFINRTSELRKEIRNIIKSREKSIRKIQRIKVDLSLLANPLFDKTKIKQDKVDVLGDFMKDPKKAEKWIDKYIKFVFKCWKYGFSERTFNFTINNEVNKSGKVVLIDFGELTFRKRQVKKAIRKKRWEKSWSFNKDLNKEIKEYYKKRMENTITIENLKKYWKNVDQKTN